MTKYIITIIIAVIIYVPLSIAACYTKNRKGKSYELLDNVKMLSGAFVWLGIGNWLLARFFNGENSAIGWWLLAFSIGAVLTSFLNVLVRKFCERIWPKAPEMVIESVKISKKLSLIIDIVAALIFLAFSAFFCYGLLFCRTKMSASDMVLISFCALLFIAGAIGMGQKVIKNILLLWKERKYDL